MTDDLFGGSDEEKRIRLRALGWTERLYATRSGVPSRYWTDPGGNSHSEIGAFAWLDSQVHPDDGDQRRQEEKP